MDYVTKDIIYVGVNDHDVDLFEGQYAVPNGISYNSYVMLDEKIAVFDTVDRSKADEWMENVRMVLTGRRPDYLIVQHMEPDHSASIEVFLETYPDVAIVGNSQIRTMIENYFPGVEIKNYVVMEDGQTLSLGRHRLTFVHTPMVHWPEVMMVYDATEKVLFSADGFGKFGALDIEEDWTDEARRYYIGIVGKYGKWVQEVLQKAATLDIEIICPLHGPVLEHDLGKYIALYDKWSSYRPEEEGICICYTSVYGGTKEAARILYDQLKKRDLVPVEIFDLARCDTHQAVAKAFQYSKLVLATTTYNGDIYPFMKTFINELIDRNYQKRKIAFIENGSWAPQAATSMRKAFSTVDSLQFADNQVKIMSVVTEKARGEINALAAELLQEYEGPCIAPGSTDSSTLFKIGYGLYVVTCRDGDKDNGLIVNTVSQISSGDPTTLMIGINKESYSAEVISKTKKLNISVLDETAPLEVFKHFGYQSGRDVPKFKELKQNKGGIPHIEGNNIWTYAEQYINNLGSEKSACDYNVVEWDKSKRGVKLFEDGIMAGRSSNGLYYIANHTNAFISAEVINFIDNATHCVYICKVTESAVLPGTKTMTYDYYQNNVKPGPGGEEKGFICKICGYVYEGDALPEGYICPICKHGVEAFERL